MCIRDRATGELAFLVLGAVLEGASGAFCLGTYQAVAGRMAQPCLLYTSDAADERSSVDLGGRRIIKKKNTKYRINRHGV